MKRTTKIVSVLLAVMMVFSCFAIVPASAYDHSSKAPGSNFDFGDVNRDGVIDIFDATAIQKYAVDKVTFDDEQKLLGDVNNDGTVDILDATAIQKFVVDKIEKFPAEEAVQPTTEPVTEPVTEPTTEPVTEPVTEPTTEPVTEPVTEQPTTEPATEPVTEPVVASTYTVAGSATEIFGTSWDASNTANDMTFNESTGLYEITYPSVEQSDSVQLKVVENHGWDVSYPEQNITFDVTAVGDVTVTFNPETKEVKVTGDTVKMITGLEVKSVIAVGNGEDTYLNGSNWDPCDPANALTEVADGVWEMTMEDIYAFDNYQIKFAINSVDEEGNPVSNPWASNFGSEFEQQYPTGEELDAVWNGKNCIFEVEEDESVVKLQLDLRNFDFTSKTGAKMTITVSTYEEPVTEPTTEPATEPVTEQPTTEPATEPATEPVTEPVVASTYTVAGSAAEIFGTSWDASNTANDMTFNESTGLYEITYPSVEQSSSVQLKVVENNGWDVSYPEQNVTFDVTAVGDVTVTFNPETKEVKVTGDTVKMVTGLEVKSVIAVGNGEDTYLNGSNWDPCDPANALTEVSDGVWEITMEDIYAFDNYQIKFAINSVDEEGNPVSNPWASNFGSELEQQYPTGEELDAVWNGKNCIFEVEEDGSAVKVQLDLRNFDFNTKSGAKMTISIVGSEPIVEPTTEPATEPVTEQPTTEPATEPVTEPAPESKYTVAGSAAAIFGTSWDSTNSANDMTFNETTGLFEITYTDVEAADSVQLKVLENNNWDTSYPEQNVTFDVTATGDVTVTIDPETKEVKVTGDTVKMVTGLEVKSVIAVGNGEDTYLNGANWDPCDTSNALTEVEDGVWEMTMEDIYAFDNYQIKFAINSIDDEGKPVSNPWASNFGSELEQQYPTNEELDAFWDGKNCIFEVEEDESVVKLQLDLRNFDFTSKTGAKMTITVSTYEEPVTEPTTEPATEPVTEQPTTEPATEPVTEPVVASTYTVAGSATEIFGTSWDSTNSANDMTLNEDTGLFEITYKDVEKADSVQLKVLENNNWDTSYPEQNVTFNVTATGDVTVTIDPETKEVKVTGDTVEMVTGLDVKSVIAVGNGEDTYLNGANWDPCDMSNALTEVEDGVWEMTMEDIYAFDNYQIKFAINSVDEEGNPVSNPWASNFGSEIEQQYPTGEELDAVWNGKNCIFEVEEDESTVTLRLDLRNFDFATKTGAKMTITVAEPEYD